MAPNAKADDLVYVSNLGNDSVAVYSWHEQKLVGRLSGFKSPQGVCADKVGNVFVADQLASKIFEYRHGGETPIATLSDPGGPKSCSVDPTTGNLAVTNVEGSQAGQGSVAVYRNASSAPTEYTSSSLYYPYYCGYDDKGNLFIDGEAKPRYKLAFVELRSGASTLTNVSLNRKITSPGAVQWDGKYLAVGVPDSNAIYQFTIEGSSGRLEGATDLDGAPGPVFQFWIARFRNHLGEPQGTRVVGAADGDAKNIVLYWKYPAGGAARHSITDGLEVPYGVTVSMGKT
jgi:hypothetical protein